MHHWHFFSLGGSSHPNRDPNDPSVRGNPNRKASSNSIPDATHGAGIFTCIYPKNGPVLFVNIPYIIHGASGHLKSVSYES